MKTARNSFYGTDVRETPTRESFIVQTLPTPFKTNITLPHLQEISPIGSVTKSSTAESWHENLVEKFNIFVQDFVTIKTGVMGLELELRLSQNLTNLGKFQ